MRWPLPWNPMTCSSTTATPTTRTLAGAKRSCAAGDSTSFGTGISGGEEGALLGLKTFAQISDRRAASGKTANRSDSAEAHRILPAQREVFATPVLVPASSKIRGTAAAGAAAGERDSRGTGGGTWGQRGR